jgi:hypothetical protein
VELYRFTPSPTLHGVVSRQQLTLGLSCLFREIAELAWNYCSIFYADESHTFISSTNVSVLIHITLTVWRFIVIMFRFIIKVFAAALETKFKIRAALNGSLLASLQCQKLVYVVHC